MKATVAQGTPVPKDAEDEAEGKVDEGPKVDEAHDPEDGKIGKAGKADEAPELADGKTVGKTM